jgi:hypothetical protein
VLALHRRQIAWPPGKRKLVVLAVEGFCAEKIHEKIFTAYEP